ncbi:hypothetical protein HII31_02586 [Pseudocercospora fuligena]|uniref:Uncharacterized protein n=1 Tax=Pseudocercospora fuligena TaxID=685502 RepID=A0A8H6RQN8_9PEZI|nr:hypothetical protein HII31_02586 [Pseudocercospora fuligena]
MSAPQCSLLDLPQELLEIICDYAYPHPGDSTVLFKNRWERRELERKSKNPQHEIVPFPRPKVNDFLVCKRFFITSARAYSSRGRFEYVSLCNSDTLRRVQGIFCQWVTSLKMLFMDVHGFKRKAFPSLRDVQLVVQAHFFYDLEPNAIFQRECSYQELKSSRMYDTVTRKLTGLQRFQIIPNYDCQVIGHHQQFKANLQRFDGLLKPFVLGSNPTALQANESSKSGSMPLYIGSAVNMDASMSRLTTTLRVENQQKATGAQDVSFPKPTTLAAAKARHQEWRQRDGVSDTCSSDMDLEAAECGFGSTPKHGAERLQSKKPSGKPHLLGTTTGIATEEGRSSRSIVTANQRGTGREPPEASSQGISVELTPRSYENGVILDSRATCGPLSPPRGQSEQLSGQWQLPKSERKAERYSPAAGSAIDPLTTGSNDQTPTTRQIRGDRPGLQRSTATVADLLAQEKENWNDVYHLCNMFTERGERLSEVDPEADILNALRPPVRHIYELEDSVAERRPTGHIIAPVVQVDAANTERNG